MKHIGILGITAEGASLCYQTIVSQSARILGENMHPAITLHTTSFAEILKAQKDSNWEKVSEICLESIKVLKNAKVDFVIIPANSIHYAYDLMKIKSPIPILSIVDVTVNECLKREYKKVGVLGIGITMSGDLYTKPLEENGIEAYVPSAKDQDILNEIIYKEIVLGIKNDQSTQKILRIIQDLKDKGVEAVILGCTELPLVISEGNSPIPIIDTTRLLAIKAVEESLR